MTPRRRSRTTPLPPGVTPDKLPTNVRWEPDRARWVYRFWDGAVRRKVTLGGADLSLADLHRAVEDTTTGAVDTLRKLGRRFQNSREFHELAPATRRQYEQCHTGICDSKNRFEKKRGDLPLLAWDAPACKRYYSERRETSESVAAAQLRYLRRLFSWAVEEGYATVNPAKAVKMKSPPPRTHYVQDDDYQAALALAPVGVALILHLMYLTGRRRGDITRLTRSSVQSDGLYFEESKTGKLTLVMWTRELRQTVDLALETCAGSWWLFPAAGDRNMPVLDSTLDTALQRLRKRMHARGFVPFQAKDLRAKHASDLEEKGGDATESLQHANREVTVRHYLRRPKKVRSLR